MMEYCRQQEAYAMSVQKLIFPFLMVLLSAGASGQSSAAGSQSVATVSIIKPVPCAKMADVENVRSLYGDPDTIKWARTRAGQMSAFIWSATELRSETVTLFTYRSDNGFCRLIDGPVDGLDWLTL